MSVADRLDSFRVHLAYSPEWRGRGPVHTRVFAQEADGGDAMRKMALGALLWASLLGACSAHSPFIIANTTEGVPAKEGSARRQPHANAVLVTESDLPADIKYEVLEHIEVGRIWYGRSKTVDASMAERAREIGADAIILTKHWRQPSGFSWAAPHGSGQAVKFLNPETINLKTLPGAWL